MPTGSPEFSSVHDEVFHRSHQAFVVVGLDGAIHRANPAAWRALGGPDEEITRHPWSHYVVDDALSRAGTADSHARGVSSGVVHLRRLDGSVFPAEYGSALMAGVSGDPVSFVQFREITDRQLELQALVQTSLDGFWLVGPDRRLLDVNDAACAMLGYTRAEMLRLGIRDIEADEGPDEYETHHARILRDGRDRFEARHLRKDGTPVDVEVSLHRTALGGAAFACFVRDLTASRESERRLLESARLAALGTLVTGVAHEVNNPLTGALSDLATAGQDLEELRAGLRDGRSPEPAELDRRLGEVAEMIRDAQRSNRRIAGIVRDLSLLGRPDPHRTRIRPADVVREAVSTLPPAVTGRVRLAVVADDALEVLASAGQLGQVVVNLVTNAANAVPPGRQGVVTVRVGAGEPGTVRIEVEDDGAGIPPGVLDHLFEPFFTTRRAEGGTGLGLAISQAIVKAHGGRITVTSEVGVGSTFRVELAAAA